jgi:phage baseplate assembly protein W
MDVGTVLGRGVAFPFRVGPDGHIAWSEGEDNIRDAIRVILSTERRERVMLPAFGAGLRSLLFEPNTPATRASIQAAITIALAQWEPRIAVQSVNVDPHPDDPKTAIATIVYTLVATQVEQALGLAISLA